MRSLTISLVRLVGIALLGSIVGGCAAKPLAQFEVQYPARLTIKKEIRKIFIDPAKINADDDRLQIKSLVIGRLREKLNRFGRFTVIVGPVAMENPEKETVALIQGDIYSGEQVEDGQFTEVATCRGGIRGFAGGITAAKTSKQGITVSRRGYVCKAADLKAELVGIGIGSLLKLGGLDLPPDPVDEVVRVYKVKNVSLFAQLDFSINEIGKDRETIAIRSDSANFGRQIVKSARNVHETYLTLPEALPLLVSPVSPLFVRRFAVVDATNRGTLKGRYIGNTTPKASDIPAKERSEIVKTLVEESLQPFVRTISPYRKKAGIRIAESGDRDAAEAIRREDWKRAHELLREKSSRKPADEYNYGLTFEATAESADDFREAKRLYLSAFDGDPGNAVYARGIGRMERRLKEYGAVREQTRR